MSRNPVLANSQRPAFSSPFSCFLFFFPWALPLLLPLFFYKALFLFFNNRALPCLHPPFFALPSFLFLLLRVLTIMGVQDLSETGAYDGRGINTVAEDVKFDDDGLLKEDVTVVDRKKTWFYYAMVTLVSTGFLLSFPFLSFSFFFSFLFFSFFFLYFFYFYFYFCFSIFFHLLPPLSLLSSRINRLWNPSNCCVQTLGLLSWPLPLLHSPYCFVYVCPHLFLWGTRDLFDNEGVSC